nr:hypothetical protein [Pandoravirus massiliensis]
MDGSVVASHGTRAARDVLTLWRGCYQDARLIDTPWADGDRALAIVHALDFGFYEHGANSDRLTSTSTSTSSRNDDAERGSTGTSGDTNDGEGEFRGVLLNGLLVRSPLAAPTGTYTAERAINVEGHPWVHLYRACVPDLPGTNGRRSSAQVYVKALEAAGLDMATNASLFTGLCWPMGRGLQAQMRVVTHQNVGLDPIEFARRTLVALGAAERAVRRRAARAIAAADAVTDAIEHEIDRLRTRILGACESVAVTTRTPPASLRHRHRRDAAPVRSKRESRDRSDRGDRHSVRARRRGDRRRDDNVEPVWCVTHERWERASVSCADSASLSTTTTTTTMATSIDNATQSASESATGDLNGSAAAFASSSLSLMPSYRPLAGTSSLTDNLSSSHESSPEHSPSPSSPVSSSSSTSACSSSSPHTSSSSSTVSTVQSSCATTAMPSQASEAGSRDSRATIDTHKSKFIAFDITECSEDIYSCCSECCSSSGCSCSVDASTRDDTASSVGLVD